MKSVFTFLIFCLTFSAAGPALAFDNPFKKAVDQVVDKGATKLGVKSGTASAAGSVGAVSGVGLDPNFDRDRDEKNVFIFKKQLAEDATSAKDDFDSDLRSAEDTISGEEARLVHLKAKSDTKDDVNTVYDLASISLSGGIDCLDRVNNQERALSTSPFLMADAKKAEMKSRLERTRKACLKTFRATRPYFDKMVERQFAEKKAEVDSRRFQEDVTQFFRRSSGSYLDKANDRKLLAIFKGLGCTVIPAGSGVEAKCSR